MLLNAINQTVFKPHLTPKLPNNRFAAIGSPSPHGQLGSSIIPKQILSFVYPPVQLRWINSALAVDNKAPLHTSSHPPPADSCLLQQLAEVIEQWLHGWRRAVSQLQNHGLTVEESPSDVTAVTL